MGTLTSLLLTVLYRTPWHSLHSKRSYAQRSITRERCEQESTNAKSAKENRHARKGIGETTTKPKLKLKLKRDGSTHNNFPSRQVQW